MRLRSIFAACAALVATSFAAKTTTTSVCSTVSSTKSVKSVKTTTVSTVTVSTAITKTVTTTPTTTVTPNKPTTTFVTQFATKIEKGTDTVSATSTWYFYSFLNVTGTSTSTLTYTSSSYSSTTIVPTPSGWLPLSDTRNGYPKSNNKRDVSEAESEHELFRRANYPVSVVCTKSIILPPDTVTATATARAVKITLPPSTVTKTTTVTTTSTSTPHPQSVSGAPDAFTFTTVSWISSTQTVSNPIYTIEYTTTTVAANPTGVATKYAICDSQYMYGPTAEDGNSVLSLYDPPGYNHRFFYPVFTAEDCCNMCASQGACTGAAWYYGHSCFLLLTYNNQCGAQTDYHESYLESTTNVDNFLNDTIMNGPCGFVTWDTQVLDSTGAMAKRQMADVGIVQPGQGGFYGGPGVKDLQ